MTQRLGQRRGAVSLKGKALQWLAQREHSRLELARKLMRWRVEQAESADPGQQDEPADSAEAVERALDELAKAGLLSDERFSHSRVHLRQSRFGNRRIEQELRQHGVTVTPEQLSELRASEVARALTVLRTRYKAAAEETPTPEQFQRAQRFLAARGFSSDAIRAATRAWARPTPSEDH